MLKVSELMKSKECIIFTRSLSNLIDKCTYFIHIHVLKYYKTTKWRLYKPIVMIFLAILSMRFLVLILRLTMQR